MSVWVYGSSFGCDMSRVCTENEYTSGMCAFASLLVCTCLGGRRGHVLMYWVSVCWHFSFCDCVSPCSMGARVHFED